MKGMTHLRKQTISNFIIRSDDGDNKNNIPVADFQGAAIYAVSCLLWNMFVFDLNYKLHYIAFYAIIAVLQGNVTHVINFSVQTNMFELTAMAQQ